MKTKLTVSLFIFALVALGAVAQSMVYMGQWVRVNTDTSTPVTLTNVVVQARRLTLVGKKDNRTANTGTVWVGMLATDNTQPIEIPSGLAVGILIPENTKIDLSKIYLDVATASDGVLIIYE